MNKGYVQVYTGDGKGKTTAALGLLLRAYGAGLRVYMGQFIKGGPAVSSEIKILSERFPEAIVEQYGKAGFICGEPTPEDISRAKDGLRRFADALKSGEYDLMIADEANCAVDLGLLTVDELLSLLDARPPHVELVITGRNAPEALIRRADLVTNMGAVKHYFENGVEARKGIEF